MSKASISFEDSEEGVVMTLNFDDPLPAEVENATEAQIQAMILFTSLMGEANDGVDMPDDEVIFNDGESEEAASEV